MSFKPNSAQGAVYPNCQKCNATDVAVYVADMLKLSDDNQRRFKALPNGKTSEQIREAFLPWILCAACVEQHDVSVAEELPWPPPPT